MAMLGTFLAKQMGTLWEALGFAAGLLFFRLWVCLEPIWIVLDSLSWLQNRPHDRFWNHLGDPKRPKAWILMFSQTEQNAVVFCMSPHQQNMDLKLLTNRTRRSRIAVEFRSHPSRDFQETFKRLSRDFRDFWVPPPPPLRSPTWKQIDLKMAYKCHLVLKERKNTEILFSPHDYENFKGSALPRSPQEDSKTDQERFKLPPRRSWGATRRLKKPPGGLPDARRFRKSPPRGPVMPPWGP